MNIKMIYYIVTEKFYSKYCSFQIQIYCLDLFFFSFIEVQLLRCLKYTMCSSNIFKNLDNILFFRPLGICNTYKKHIQISQTHSWSMTVTFIGKSSNHCLFSQPSEKISKSFLGMKSISYTTDQNQPWKSFNLKQKIQDEWLKELGIARDKNVQRISTQFIFYIFSWLTVKIRNTHTDVLKS